MVLILSKNPIYGRNKHLTNNLLSEEIATPPGNRGGGKKPSLKVPAGVTLCLQT